MRHDSFTKQISAAILLFFFFIACSQPTKLEQALDLAGENRIELQNVLDHYSKNPKDSLKYKAACFLIENMIYHYSFKGSDVDSYYSQVDSIFSYAKETKEGSDSILENLLLNKNDLRIAPDIENITAQFLIDHIDNVFVTNGYPWCRQLLFKDFCEYILPYRVANEPIENWRPIYQKRFAMLIDSMVAQNLSDTAACKYVLEYFSNSHDLSSFAYALDLPPSSLLNMQKGKCRDLVSLTIYAMRSIGIPVAWDFTPQWGNRSLGHDWAVLIGSDYTIPFLIGDKNALGDHLKSKSRDKMPKAYRKMFSIQNESLIFKNIKEDFPPFFKSPYIKDVSDTYGNNINIEVKLSIPPPSKKEFAYIAVFNNQNWVPIHCSKINNGKARFTGMFKDCVYLPVYYDNGSLYPASPPLLVDKEGNIKELYPKVDITTSVILKRKFPFGDYGVLIDRMPGGRFQTANKSDFSDAVDVYTIDTLDEMRPYLVTIDKPVKCSYFRYLSSDKGHVFMAEIDVYNDSGEKIVGEIIGTDGSFGSKGSDKTKVFDGDLFTFFDAPHPSGCWAGLAFGEKILLKEIKFIPKNDDNFISDSESYELYYWDNKWVSLGQRQGDKSHLLEYDNVPLNALLLLKNHSKGKEERIFTYEDGKQIWW